MPLYEYECTKCGHQIEVLQKFSDAPINECDQCKGKMKRLISQSTFHLKGTGWYVTDYASKSGKNKGVSPGTEKKTPKAEAKAEKKGNSGKKSDAGSAKTNE
jgi:putative FmdB family regulatory protein